MQPSLTQTKQDDQTAKENALRERLRLVEQKLEMTLKFKADILIELGECFVERMDEEQ